jgi:hypothetical protein
VTLLVPEGGAKARQRVIEIAARAPVALSRPLASMRSLRSRPPWANVVRVTHEPN